MKHVKRLICISLLAALLMAPAVPAHGAGSVLRYGSRGDDVKQLQGNLIYLGYLDDVADGIYGANTQAAVRLYQRTNGLSVDGAAGSATNRAIQAEVLRVLRVIDYAKALLGTPYVYGGCSAGGFDCSGFTQYVYKRAGINIPRVSYEQAAAGRAVNYGDMRPGDLLCFNSPVSHVGIYLGGGMLIHASSGAGQVKILGLQHMELTGIRRFTGAVPA